MLINKGSPKIMKTIIMFKNARILLTLSKHILGISDPDDQSKPDPSKPEAETGSIVSERQKPITFFKAVLLPGVIAVSIFITIFNMY